MKGQYWLVIGAVLAAAGVALGAYQAHGLQAWLETTGATADQVTRRMHNADVAVRYQMYHALGLLALGNLLLPGPRRLVAGACALLLVGVLLFSGGLYLIVFAGTALHWAIVPRGRLDPDRRLVPGRAWHVPFRRGPKEKTHVAGDTRSPSDVSCGLGIRDGRMPRTRKTGPASHTAVSSSTSLANRFRATCNRRLIVPSGARTLHTSPAASGHRRRTTPAYPGPVSAAAAKRRARAHAAHRPARCTAACARPRRPRPARSAPPTRSGARRIARLIAMR